MLFKQNTYVPLSGELPPGQAPGELLIVGKRSLEPEGPEESQVSWSRCTFPQHERSSFRWAKGSRFGETVRTQQLGTLGVAGMPTPQGLAF